jgi:hypothetical protein
MRDYMRTRYRERRTFAVAYLGGKCLKCGSIDDLQFDHIDRTTKYRNLPEMGFYSQKRFMEELGKCQLLCGDCHRAKTFVDFGQVSARGSHGTLSSFRYCKCDLCRKASRDYNRARKIRITGNEPKPRTDVIKHGTRAGYLKEGYLKMEHCRACMDANTAYTRELKLRKKNGVVPESG